MAPLARKGAMLAGEHRVAVVTEARLQLPCALRGIVALTAILQPAVMNTVAVRTRLLMGESGLSDVAVEAQEFRVAARERDVTVGE